MVFLNLSAVTVALGLVLLDENRASAFVPADFRTKIGGGKNGLSTSTPPEILSFASLYQKAPKEYQQNSPRMTETSFRLDYIQGIRPSFNKGAADSPVKDEHDKTNEETFIYGHDSSCYRGLTKPTEAGLVLALLLVSGMIATSPDFHNLSLPSLPLLLEGSRHLLGDDIVSELSSLIERMAFQWDMSEINDASNQVLTSLSNELVPFLSRQQENLKEAMVTLPDQFNVFFAQIASQFDSIRDEVASKFASSEVMMSQALARGKDSILQAKIDQWNIDSFRDEVKRNLASSEVMISQALARGKDSILHAKIDQWNIDSIRDEVTSKFASSEAMMSQALARSKDSILHAKIDQWNIDSFRDEVTSKFASSEAMISQALARSKDAILQTKIDQWNIDSIRDKVTSKFASSEVMMSQALASGKDAFLRQCTEWQLASQANIDKWNHHVMQATSHLRGGIDEVFSKGKEIFEGELLGFRNPSATKMSKLEYGLIPDGDRLQTQTIEYITRGKDHLVLKSSEFERASQTGLDEFKREIFQTHQQVQGLANQYSADAKVVLAQKYTDLQQAFQHSSEAKMIDAGKEIIQGTDSIKRTLKDTGVEYEMKLNDIGSDLSTMVQSLRQDLNDKTSTFQDTSLVHLDEIKDHVSFQGSGLIDDAGDTLQKLNEGVNKELPDVTNSVKNHAVVIGRRNDLVTTESASLRAILNDLTY